MILKNIVRLMLNMVFSAHYSFHVKVAGAANVSVDFFIHNMQDIPN